MHRHVVCHEVTFGDEVMVIDRDVPEIGIDRGNDPLPAFAALWTGGVVDHVFGYEFIDDVQIACCRATKELLDYELRFSSVHRYTMHQDGIACVGQIGSHVLPASGGSCANTESRIAWSADSGLIITA